ncbi:hypothetical protein PPERSA_03888 [Pseudocohnilembus persalinus]|uniref:Uncharacterized protein n=1 Tax=Pseudocohnilembus persalinus TaxID=266149 RepID=A0A0V0Q9B1_PSEPJ|nr:hypothetical protein PPERSA_03888 [Pseudocohnilembus persalinus]|eukprot:KRW98753.1 hypothetical protein PPERSA_03888 [Pseudocohnilembus persalinus]
MGSCSSKKSLNSSFKQNNISVYADSKRKNDRNRSDFRLNLYKCYSDSPKQESNIKKQHEFNSLRTASSTQINNYYKNSSKKISLIHQSKSLQQDKNIEEQENIDIFVTTSNKFAFVQQSNREIQSDPKFKRTISEKRNTADQVFEQICQQQKQKQNKCQKSIQLNSLITQSQNSNVI